MHIKVLVEIREGKIQLGRPKCRSVKILNVS